MSDAHTQSGFAIVLVFALALSMPAGASCGGGHGATGHGGSGGGGAHHGSGGHHHHGVFAGAFFGNAYFWPWTYAGPYATVLYDVPIWMPPSTVDPTYSAQPSTAATGYFWYYCADSQTYYPYVQQCASGWQKVVPQPPAN
jgi:hypothetical protein